MQSYVEQTRSRPPSPGACVGERRPLNESSNHGAFSSRFWYAETLAVITEDQERFLRRVALSFLLVSVLSLALPAASCAQALPRGRHIDGSVRLEYLFGAQRIREAATANFLTWPNRVTADYNPSFWLITGLSEVSPSPRVSLRLSGSTNIPSSEHDIARLAFAPQGGTSLGGVWPARTTFVSLETVGAYHFADDGLYRLSVCAGYRYEWWRRAGESGNQVLQDSLASSIPFLGLGAAISLPGWRSRLEVIGSPFMSTTVSLRAALGAASGNYTFTAGRGGISVNLGHIIDTFS